VFLPDGSSRPRGPVHLRPSHVVANFDAISYPYICFFVSHNFVISEVKRIQQHTVGAVFEFLVLA
jgi:hypothetical protein